MGEKGGRAQKIPPLTLRNEDACQRGNGGLCNEGSNLEHSKHCL